ncbi:MAG TPA: hypothetical protein VFF07_03130 [Actinomycetota bacterium]|nr:hypothetical protein [Actinomycetota bacterium]
MAFGEQPELRDPYLMPGETSNGGRRFREWPGRDVVAGGGVCVADRWEGLQPGHRVQAELVE